MIYWDYTNRLRCWFKHFTLLYSASLNLQLTPYPQRTTGYLKKMASAFPIYSANFRQKLKIKIKLKSPQKKQKSKSLNLQLTAYPHRKTGYLKKCSESLFS